MLTFSDRFADTCARAHDTNEQRKALTMAGFVGQNSYFAPGIERNFTDAVYAWYSEVKDYPAEKVNDYRSSNVSLSPSCLPRALL